jgi:hypothetical protein
MMGGLDDETIGEMLAEKTEVIEAGADGEALRQTLFPAVATDYLAKAKAIAHDVFVEEFGTPTPGEPTPDALPVPAPDATPAKRKPGRPRKDASAGAAGAAGPAGPAGPAKLAPAKPKGPKASDVAAKLRAAGTITKRGLPDLRKVLDGRADPISVAILGYLAGTVGEGELTAALDEAEPIIPADTVYDPADSLDEDREEVEV